MLKEIQSVITGVGIVLWPVFLIENLAAGFIISSIDPVIWKFPWLVVLSILVVIFVLLAILITLLTSKSENNTDFTIPWNSRNFYLFFGLGLIATGYFAMCLELPSIVWKIYSSIGLIMVAPWILNFCRRILGKIFIEPVTA